MFWFSVRFPRANRSPPPIEGMAATGRAFIVASCRRKASMETTRDLIELTVRVVAGFAAHNTITAAELPALIRTTYAVLSELSASRSCSRPHQRPAVPVDESVTRDYIVCLDDGRRLKTLKRYLRRKYSLTPEQYRARWDLPEDYPMVAPGYAELRSSLAKRKPLTADAASPRALKNGQHKA
jgi:predicted transcriptional regulator